MRKITLVGEGPNWSILFLIAFELFVCNLRALIQLYSNVKLHGLLVTVYSNIVSKFWVCKLELKR